MRSFELLLSLAGMFGGRRSCMYAGGRNVQKPFGLLLSLAGRACNVQKPFELLLSLAGRACMQVVAVTLPQCPRADRNPAQQEIGLCSSARKACLPQGRQLPNFRSCVFAESTDSDYGSSIRASVSAKNIHIIFLFVHAELLDKNLGFIDAFRL